MDFRNSYEDAAYAAAYAKLEFPGTYYLAFRDLPELLSQHVTGKTALDFGCGTGRSTRFLAQLGFETTGVDISPEMIQHAQARDPKGDYRLLAEGDLSVFPGGSFDLVLSAFTFDNIPGLDLRLALMRGLRRVLRPDGCMANLVSTPEMYWHEWASFTTRDFPGNRQACCGDQVLIINSELGDPRPAVDIIWPDEDYRRLYAEAGLSVRIMHRPLGRSGEPVAWVSETSVAPWTIYILGQAPAPALY